MSMIELHYYHHKDPRNRHWEWIKDQTLISPSHDLIAYQLQAMNQEVHVHIHTDNMIEIYWTKAIVESSSSIGYSMGQIGKYAISYIRSYSRGDYYYRCNKTTHGSFGGVGLARILSGFLSTVGIAEGKVASVGKIQIGNQNSMRSALCTPDLTTKSSYFVSRINPDDYENLRNTLVVTADTAREVQVYTFFDQTSNEPRLEPYTRLFATHPILNTWHTGLRG